MYLPLFTDGKLPETLALGTPDLQEGSAWWTFKRLQLAIEADFEPRLAEARERFDALEARWLGESGDPSERMAEASAHALET